MLWLEQMLLTFYQHLTHKEKHTYKYTAHIFATRHQHNQHTDRGAECSQPAPRLCPHAPFQALKPHSLHRGHHCFHFEKHRLVRCVFVIDVCGILLYYWVWLLSLSIMFVKLIRYYSFLLFYSIPLHD